MEYKYLKNDENNSRNKVDVLLDCNKEKDLLDKLIVREEINECMNYIVFNSLDNYLRHFEKHRNNASYHEVILHNMPRKFYFDIDCEIDISTEDYNAEIAIIRNIMLHIFSKYYTVIIEVEDIIEVTAHGFISENKYKHSSNLIIKKYLLANYNEFQVLGHKIIKEYKKVSALNLIDETQFISNDGKRLLNNRLIHSLKNGTRQKISDAKFEHCVLTNKLDAKLLPITFAAKKVTYSKDNVITNENELLNLPKVRILKQLQYFTYRDTTGNSINFNRITSSYCDICERTHDTDNTFRIIKLGNKLFYVCRHDPDNTCRFICFIDENKCVKPQQQIFKQITTDINEANYNCCIESYTDKINSDAFTDKKVNIIKAEMKLGKTKALIQHIEEVNYETIIIISFRRTFSADICSKMRKLDFVSYSDIIGDIKDVPRLIIQVESLHRIKIPFEFDLVVLDETESIWTQFSSSNFANFSICMNKFEAILKNTRKLICMDANISVRTDQILKQIFSYDDCSLYINYYNPCSTYKYYICADKKSWIYKLNSLLANKNNNVAIFTNSLAESDRLYEFITKIISANNIMQYNSRTKESIKKLHFNDVNNYWAKFRCIICTPTVSAGISFETEHFDYVFGYFSNKSCSVETCRQMLGRVRNISTNEIYLYLNDGRDKYETDISIIKDLIKRDKMELFSNSNIGLLNFTIDCVNNILDPKDEFAFEIITQNIFMQNNSNSCFTDRFIEQIKGAKLEMQATIILDYKEENRLIEQVYKTYLDGKNTILTKKTTEVFNADDISKHRYIELKKQKANLEDISENDLLAIEKYKLRSILNTELTKELVEKFISKKDDLYAVKNMREIYSGNSIDASINNLYNILKEKNADYKSSYLLYNSAHKHKICMDLCKLFDPPINLNCLPYKKIDISDYSVNIAQFDKHINENLYIYDLPKETNLRTENDCKTALNNLLHHLYGVPRSKQHELRAPNFINFKKYGAIYNGSCKSSRIKDLPTINIELLA